MARTVKEADLSTRESRSKLKSRPKPHWRLISKGRHIGYRKPPGRKADGTWIARRYVGQQKYSEHSLGLADDQVQANGYEILDFAQAQQAASDWFNEQDGRAGRGPYTVEQCLDDYLAWLEKHKKSAPVARSSVDARIRPKLGKLDVADLTPDIIERWHQNLASAPARLRSGEGKEVRTRKIENDEDIRRRKDTANRILSILKAALNRTYKHRKVHSDHAWRTVRPFPNVQAARPHWLEIDDAIRLLNGCDEDFRLLVQGALTTGARYGELIRMRVRDYSSQSGSVEIPQSKGGQPRDVFLNEEGTSLFEQLTLGRHVSDLIFLRADRLPWGKSHQSRRMKEACRTAKIDPPVPFYALRHTYAAHYLMNKGTLFALGKQLGHADTRMVEKHYGKLAQDWRRQEAHEHAPIFGIEHSEKKIARHQPRGSEKTQRKSTSAVFNSKDNEPYQPIAGQIDTSDS